MRLSFVIAALVFLLEFFVKTYLRANLAFQSIPVIKNIFHITVIFNKGAAFGILRGKTNFLVYATVVFILIFILVMKKESKKTAFFYIACGFILGGAISNLYDRIFLGYVVDYLDFRIWPVFNLSDSCITTGAFLLLWRPYAK